MALEEKTYIDKIEIIPNVGAVQVRVKTDILRGDAVVTSSFERYVLLPGQDVAGQPDLIRSLCDATWANMPQPPAND